MASDLENTLRDVIDRLALIERRLDDIESQSGETTSFDVALTLPNDPYPGQIVLLTTEAGTQGNGTIYRFDDSANDWQLVV